MSQNLAVSAVQISCEELGALYLLLGWASEGMKVHSNRV